MSEIDIEECHHILLDIMKEVHAISVDSNIPYYMIGGSMLGAIRHKGFIPWDDDFDIGIERKYYESFLTIARTKLSSHLMVTTHENSPGIFFGFAKIQDTRTLLFEKANRCNSDECRIGINVDIFPLDLCNEDLKGYNVIRCVFRLQRLLYFNSSSPTFFKNLFRSIARVFWPFSKNFLVKIINRLIAFYSVYNGNTLVSFWSGHGRRAACSRIVWGKPTLYEFNGLNFFGPENYDDYLRSLFNDYMKMPPKKKQVVHSDRMKWKEKRYKLGYTTGVFDMFHVGHLNILKRSKALCDRLIVGVSTDELVQSYKNKTPVIPFKNRCEIIASVKYVDEVVAQKHRDKVKSLEEIGFDVMFVGSDWKGSELFNTVESTFKNKGVDLIYLPHTDGISSSLLRERIDGRD